MFMLHTILNKIFTRHHYVEASQRHTTAKFISMCLPWIFQLMILCRAHLIVAISSPVNYVKFMMPSLLNSLGSKEKSRRISRASLMYLRNVKNMRLAKCGLGWLALQLQNLKRLWWSPPFCPPDINAFLKPLSDSLGQCKTYGSLKLISSLLDKFMCFTWRLDHVQ